MTVSVSRRRDEILRLLQQASPRMVSDLSRELGVSMVTVRRDVDALAEEGRLRRSHGSVSALTGARADRSSRDRLTFGMIVPHTEYYFASIIQGAKSAAATVGARLLPGVSGYEAPLERRLADRLLLSGVDGLLFAPTPDFLSARLDADAVRWLLDCPVPVVLVDRSPGDVQLAAQVDSVGMDHGAGAALAVRHLRDLGHRRVVLVCKPGPNASGIIGGYRSAVSSSSMDSLGEIFVEDPGDELVRRVVALHEAGATAAFVHNDQIAIALLARLGAAGISVPEDLSLVCYDDVTAALVSPPLTAVAPRKQELGERAVQLLLRAVRDDDGGREHVLLTPPLRVRSSSWPFSEAK